MSETLGFNIRRLEFDDPKNKYIIKKQEIELAIKLYQLIKDGNTYTVKIENNQSSDGYKSDFNEYIHTLFRDRNYS